MRRSSIFDHNQRFNDPLLETVKGKIVSVLREELEKQHRAFVKMLEHNSSEEEIAATRNLLMMYACLMENPGYLIDKLPELNRDVLEFIDKYPQYILRIVNNAAISPSKLLRFFPRPSDVDSAQWEKNRIAAIAKDKRYQKELQSSLSKIDQYAAITNIFRVLNRLFNNMSFTLSGEKYRTNRLLHDLQEHLIAVLSPPENRSKMIANLLMSYLDTDIEIIRIIDRFNQSRNPVETKKEQRLNVPVEVLMRFALETGFELTHEHFYLEPDDLHRFKDKVNQDMEQDGRNLHAVMNLFGVGGPYQQAIAEPNPEKQKFAHLFNPKDEMLNTFSSQFIVELNKRVAEYNQGRGKHDAQRFVPCNSANFSFVRFNVHTANFVAVAVSVSAIAHPANVEVIRRFIADFEKVSQEKLGCHLIFVDPEHHAAKSAIPFLASLLRMSDEEVNGIYASRRHNRGQLFIDGFVDHFKGCAEIFYAGFFAQLLRLYPELQFRSVCNLAMGNPDQEYKPLCQNCCMKRSDYKLELQLARVLGDNNLLIDPEAEVDFGKITNSHSEAPGVQRVRKTIAPVYIDNADTPLKGKVVKRHRSQVLQPGTQFFETTPTRGGIQAANREEKQARATKLKFSSQSSE